MITELNQMELLKKALEQPCHAELEIGCGRTHFLFDRASAVPKHLLIGLDWKERYIKQAWARIQREQISNVAALRGCAWELVPEGIPDNRLSRVFVQFPDPWWKTYQHKRRVLRPSFIDVLARKLSVGGELFFQTDVCELFESTCDDIHSHPAFSNSKTVLSDNTYGGRTHREKHCILRGVPIYRVCFVKANNE